MANPCFGKWATEDDVNEPDIFGVVPSAEEEALKRMEKRAKVREIKRYVRQPEKLVISVKKLFSGPKSYTEKDPYGRPFTRLEAMEIATNAGLKDVRIVGAYLSGWAGCGYYDPFGQSQVIVAACGAEKIELYLQYIYKQKRWRVVRVRKINNI